MAVWSNRVLILLGALGIFITGVLSYSTWQGLAVPCGGHEGCSIVQQSEFSKFPAETGIPVAYLGLVGYLAIFLLALLRSSWVGRAYKASAVLGFGFSVFGTLFSLYLTYLSISVIQQKCVWCLSSLGVIIIATIAHAALLQEESPKSNDVRWGVASAFIALTGALGAAWGTIQNLHGQIDLATLSLDAGAVSAKEAIPGTERMFGDKSGAVTILEFFDVNCGTCRAVYPRLKRAVSSRGRGIRLAVRHFPLLNTPGHETSPAAAAIAEYAAEKGMFWRYLDEVMKEGNTQRVKSIDGLIAVAGEAGLNKGEIVTIFKSEDAANKAIAEKYWQRVDQDINIATRMNVDATPSIVLYADGHDPEPVSYRSIEGILNRAPYRGLIGGN